MELIFILKLLLGVVYRVQKMIIEYYKINIFEWNCFDEARSQGQTKMVIVSNDNREVMTISDWL